MKLRPHHVLDIVTGIGHGAEFRPHAYGHGVHTVAAAMLADLEMKIELVVGSDEICRPCMHLGADGRCDDVVRQADPPVSKQTYNDDLDERVLAYLGLAAGSQMSMRTYLEVVAGKVPGIEAICTHPGGSPDERLAGLQKGLEKLGIGGS